MSTLLCDCLQWYNITRPYERGALCNDFTTAGYFIRTNSTSQNWVIFLEGGGGCNTPSKCNERFIDHRIRKQFTSVLSNGTRIVNIETAWNSSDNQLNVMSRLMTSLWKFSPTRLNSSSWFIEGKDLLSTDVNSNPMFSDFNHVLIPYCSSDLWLLASDDYEAALDPLFTFTFNPHATSNQFTFRGAAIYRSVIEDILEHQGLLYANDVILAGSSAGGIGVLNHAQWTQDHLPSTTKLSVITDSAWFINFKDTIDKQFSRDDLQTSTNENDTCSDEDNPSLCVSAPLILTDPINYPNIPTFILFSQYDLYVLTLSLINSTDGGIIELMRVVSEYSGSMVTSRQYTSVHFSNLSYYVTSCFHHVYFATSNLWGDEDAILGNEAVDESYGNNRFV